MKVSNSVFLNRVADMDGDLYLFIFPPHIMNKCIKTMER